MMRMNLSNRLAIVYGRVLHPIVRKVVEITPRTLLYARAVAGVSRAWPLNHIDQIL